MKTILKFTACILVTSFIIFTSCSKDSPLTNSPPPPQPFLDSLTGRVFEFNDLGWKEIVSWGTNVIVEIDRPDLFYNPFRWLKVTLRFDTAAMWLEVFPETGSYHSGNNFYYAFGSDFFPAVGGRLYIYPVPGNHSLVGTKVSIRVKFL